MNYIDLAMKRRWIIFAGAGLFLAALLYNFFGPGSITDLAHESVRLHLKRVGASIYEYHARTGNWPSRLDDLAETSLASVPRNWRAPFDNGSVVIVWHDDLKSDPKKNASVILAYHNKGLIAQLGRHWVCWGDLRTEYITDDKLKANLNAAKK
jgi:hypothetical protein